MHEVGRFVSRYALQRHVTGPQRTRNNEVLDSGAKSHGGQATGLGSGSAHAIWESTLGLGVYSLGPRGTDFESGSAHTIWESTLGVYTLGVYSLGPPSLDLEHACPEEKG